MTRDQAKSALDLLYEIHRNPNHIQILPLVEAFARGEEVQYRHGSIPGAWLRLEEMAFNSPPGDYRIKPKPRELWVKFAENGLFLGYRYHQSSPSEEGYVKLVEEIK